MSSINDSATVLYSFYVESNNEAVESLSPSIVNFINIETGEDLSGSEALPAVVELQAGFYKFSFTWEQTISPKAFLIKIDTGLPSANEKFITMRLERSDYLSSAIKRLVDIEQGTWEIDSSSNELVIKHAVTGEEIGRWELFDSSGEVGTTRNPFYRVAKNISPY
jgi:hypothetical protein